uniref:Uncharacterized protein n=1 Tax=Pyxicephalus adspersus TaxID=30357 RepID=A0AAV3AZI5_PYXAD|nr:TPA: hypothetical protein GDO54_006171 [Pyxicephalus adspersus]
MNQCFIESHAVLESCEGSAGWHHLLSSSGYISVRSGWVYPNSNSHIRFKYKDNLTLNTNTTINTQHDHF